MCFNNIKKYAATN